MKKRLIRLYIILRTYARDEDVFNIRMFQRYISLCLVSNVLVIQILNIMVLTNSFPHVTDDVPIL